MLYRKFLLFPATILVLLYGCDVAFYNPFENDTFRINGIQKEITSFVFEASNNPVLSVDAIGIVGTNTIDITVPFGTSLVSLTPTIAITGTSINPGSGAPQAFTDGVAFPYTVTGSDSSTKDYTVTVYKPPTPGNGGNITFNGIGANSITVDWTKATDDQTPQANLQYLVYYSTSGNIDTVANTEANGTPVGVYATDIASRIVTGLIDSTTYYFNVIARDQNGNKTAYIMSSQATQSLDTTPPVAGNGGVLTFGSITETSITVNWTKATDNVTPQASLEYLVYYSQVCNLNTVVNIEANGTAVGTYTADIDTKTVTGLTHQKAYYFNVIVKDSAGNKRAYAMNSRLTLPGVPPTTTTAGSLTAAVFNEPFRMVIVDSYIYVTDWSNHAVYKVNTSDGTVNVFAGLPGTSGTVDGIGTAARFTNPAGICSDSTNLYIGENGGKLRKIIIATGEVVTLTTIGYSIYGLATDGMNIYLANYGNGKVDRFDIAALALYPFVGSTNGYQDGIGAAAKFNYIQDVCTDGTYLYVSDYLNKMVRKVDLATAEVTTLATGFPANMLGLDSDGTYVYIGTYAGTTHKVLISTGVVTAMPSISIPYDVVTDGARLYVADGGTLSIRTIQ